MKLFTATFLLCCIASLVSSLPHTRGGTGTTEQGDVGDHDQPIANMNGDYLLAATPHANKTELQKLFPTHYKDYPDHDLVPTESFDVYSPLISQLYSQVFWKGLPPVRLPEHIVSKYDGKVMAVIGFELDQVRVDEKDGQEKSIPMNALYNHHFESVMIGGGDATKSSTRFELVSPNDPRIEAQERTMGHGIPPNQPYWLVVNEKNNDLTSTGDDGEQYPTQQDFHGANGGEVRKSFHGYAPGYAQLIQSPRAFQITPMQIDTWHREEMDVNNFTHFVPGPLPRNSLAPRKEDHPKYSGLLECPVTTRLTKHLPPQGFVPLAKGACSSDGLISSSEDCFRAVTELVRETDNRTQIHQVKGTDDPTRPMGCSMRVVAIGDSIASHDDSQRVMEAFYNNHATTTSTAAAVDCGSSKSNLYSAFAISLVQVSVLVDKERDLVSIRLTGPAKQWFGVGFGAHRMKDEPWTIVVEGGQGGAVTERKLGEHAAGTVIEPSTIDVKSSTTSQDGTKTVVVTRAIQGRYFSFDTEGVTSIEFINAVGSSNQFGYHQNKEASSMLVLPVVTPKENNNNDNVSGTCVCQKDPPPFGAAKGGKLVYHPVEGDPGERGKKGSVPLSNKCEPRPRMDLLEEKNPTCDIRTYVGGQTACHHLWSLLDADQEIPWVDQPLEYRLKFRFWVQPHDPSYHTNVFMTRRGIGSPVEYDVPKCSEGIAGCALEVDPTTNKQRWVHTIRGTFQADGNLVAAHFHCHAPTCIMMAMYLCDDNDATCDENSGTLLCEEHAVWQKGRPEERYGEPDFIYQPPCLWGSPKFGLEDPTDITGRTLFAIKKADATYGHHGEMAWSQMILTK